MTQDSGDLQDSGDPKEELARLLRRLDDLDGPRMPATPSLDKFKADAPNREVASANDRSKALVAKPDGPLQSHANEAETARKSRTILVRGIAIGVAVTAVVGVILAVKMPPISIVVIRDGTSQSKFAPQPSTARNTPDADPRPQSPRPISPNQVDAQATGQLPTPTVAKAIDTEPAKPARPPMTVVPQTTSLQRGQVWPLGAHIAIEGDGGTLRVRGLADGAKLSVGRPAEANGWELNARDVHDAVVVPPGGFVGSMDLTVELRRGGATSDRQRLQVEWSGDAAPTQVPTVRLDPNDVARLLKRGEDLLANGEIAASRAVFEHLAENGEPRGAFALAETYEQSTLERLGVAGVLPDMAKARTWYEKARALGSVDAQGRLDQLAARTK
jgi:hypothetical protein